MVALGSLVSLSLGPSRALSVSLTPTHYHKYTCTHTHPPPPAQPHSPHSTQIVSAEPVHSCPGLLHEVLRLIPVLSVGLPSSVTAWYSPMSLSKHIFSSQLEMHLTKSRVHSFH